MGYALEAVVDEICRSSAERSLKPTSFQIWTEFPESQNNIENSDFKTLFKYRATKVEPTPEPGGKGPGACFEFSLPKWGGQLPRQIGEQLEKQFERIRSYPIEGTIHRPQFESRGKICQF